MKRIINFLLLTFALSCANAQEMPAVEDVYEIYHFCLYEIETGDDSAEYETEILNCVNQELSDSEYPTFASFKALLDYIKNYFGDDDDSLGHAQNVGNNT